MEAGRRPRSGLLAQRQALVARQQAGAPWSTGDDVGGSLAEQAAAQQAMRRSRMPVGSPRADNGTGDEATLQTWDTPAEQRPVVVRQQGDTVAERFLLKEEALAKLAQFTRLVRQLHGEDRAEVTRRSVDAIETLVREAGLSADLGATRETRRPPPVEECALVSFAPAVPARQADRRGLDSDSPTTQRRARLAAAAEARAAAAARADPATVYANMYGPRPLDEPAYTHAINRQEQGRTPSPDCQQLEDDDLVECRNCRRTFLPERLTVHLRSCRPTAGSRPISRLRRSGGTGSAADARASIQALSEAFSRLPPPSPSRPPLRPPASGVLIEAAATRAAALEPEQWIDYFSAIPDEIKVDILTYIGPPYGEASALCGMARTCRWFSRLWRAAVQSLAANDVLCARKARVDGMLHMQYSGALWQMVASCEDLRSIDLTSCRTLELIDDSIPCPLVHTLCLRACVALRSIEALGNPNLWPCLTDLDCTGCRALRMESLASVLSTAPALHTLNLSGTRALRSLAELCPPGISSVTVGTEEDAQGTGSAQHGMSEVGLLSRLRHLDLACCRQLADVGELRACQGLLFLSLRECRALRSLVGLGACMQLRELVLNGCRSLDPGALHQIGRCTSLVKLSISNIRALTDIEGLRGCTKLERLDLGVRPTKLSVPFSHSSLHINRTVSWKSLGLPHTSRHQRAL